MQTIQVDVGHARYPIAIAPGLLRDRRWMDEHVPGSSLLIVSNTTVAPLYLAQLLQGLGDRQIATCILPDGEAYKTLQTAGTVFDALVHHKLHRDATVVALGGGVVGDIAGFAAACYQRGIALFQVPTTLLAQVDSSVGGKTGVNHPGGKNLIGAFHQPVAVAADTDTLASLPDRELRAGLAEVIKYGCIWDSTLFAWLEGNVAQILARDADALTRAIARSCEIKAMVVAQDEREQNLRAILNFGHTFAHAIEAATGYARYLHGEAVALGMLLASEFSSRLGMIDADVTRRVRALLTIAGLPTEMPRIGAVRALELMQMDKKVLAGSIRLVLLERLGRAAIVGHYPQDALQQLLREYFG
ncbi:MAG: 3-dehydroquinate synthase [Steroidobacterales bacterium]